MSLVLLLLVACGGEDVGFVGGFDTGAFFECDGSSEDTLDDDFAEDLAPSGCRWRVAAADRDAYTMLLVDVPAFATALEGEAVSVTYTLPDDAVRFEVQRGCGLDVGVCTTSTAEPIVMRTYTPTSGSLAVDAEPSGDELRATLVFTDVALEDESGDTSAITSLTWPGLRLYAAPEP